MKALTFLDNVKSLSPAYYFDSLHAWRKCTQQQQKIEKWLRDYALSIALCSDQYQVLSIGPGTGIVDYPFLKHLRKKLSNDINYIGIEPNHYASELFQKKMSSLNDTKTTIKVENKKIQDHHANNYDLIVGIHVLYYEESPGQMINIAQQKLKNNGESIFFLASAQPLSEYFQYVFSKNQSITAFIAPDLKTYLTASGFDYCAQTISCYADITPCFQSGDTADMLLSYICQGDISELSSKDKNRYKEHLKSNCEQRNNRYFVKNNVDVFIINAKNAHERAAKIIQ